MTYDTTNLKVVFSGSESEKRYQHLLRKLVVASKRLGATSSWDDVFKDYVATHSKATTKIKAKGTDGDDSSAAAKSDMATAAASGFSASSDEPKAPWKKPKSGALFAYSVTMPNALVVQLMKEAKDLNCNNFPAAGTLLLRSIIEAVLKEIIDAQKANPDGKRHDIESAVNLCLSQTVSLSIQDKKVLKEFQKQHVTHLNLGAHGNVIPNALRLFAARDCIDQFVKRHV